jgi:nitrogen fixation protein NifU and related proteins
MSTDLNKFYDPVIKEHNANPYHFTKIDSATNTIKAYNPVCGDRYEFYAEVEGGILTSFHFHGYGCAVSMAAGSVLVKTLEGKSIQSAIELCNSYLGLIEHEQNRTGLPDEFYAFTVVRDFPARYECAAMAWTEVRNFLKRLT